MSGPCFSASVGGHPLRPPTRRRLGRPLPYQLADGTQVPPKVDRSFRHPALTRTSTWGISSPFELLSPASGQVTHALLTRSPLTNIATCPFDLHVLGTPPAFILSQDQTLRKKHAPYIVRFVSFRPLELSGLSSHFASTRSSGSSAWAVSSSSVSPAPRLPLFTPFPITPQLLRSRFLVLLIERAGLYHPPNGLSSLSRDQKPMSFLEAQTPLRLTSARQTVKLTCLGL